MIQPTSVFKDNLAQLPAIDGIERFNLNGNGSSLTLGSVDVIQLSQDNNAFNTVGGWTATSTGGATGWGAINFSAFGFFCRSERALTRSVVAKSKPPNSRMVNRNGRLV